MGLAFLVGYACIWSTNFVAFHHKIKEFGFHYGSGSDDQNDTNESSLSHSVYSKDSAEEVPSRGSLDIVSSSSPIQKSNDMGTGKSHLNFPLLTAYLEPYPHSSWYSTQPLPSRNITSDDLTKIAFPDANKNRYESYLDKTIQPFPVVNDYPEGDSYLPWIHDLFPSHDGAMIHFIAQNKRRCDTGEGKEQVMKDQLGQIALFQPVAVSHMEDGNFRLSSHKEADLNGIETRFLCQFKLWNGDVFTINPLFQKMETTLSQYPFNYEYVNWRKGFKGMYLEKGRDVGSFWTSTLMFDCPVPESFIPYVLGHESDITPSLFMDLIPIRTPVRGQNEQFFKESLNFDANKKWGSNHIIPLIENSGRWENIAITPLIDNIDDKSILESSRSKPYQLVACTWTSASHNRRGDSRTLSDGKNRLREWISYNLMVGFDHVVVYDNSAATGLSGNETLKIVTDLFPRSKVTYVNWPCKICNNNRPNHKNPGERSSQYAAENSCRKRFGSQTEWMAFMDPDEYFVPMGTSNTWKDILPKFDNDGWKIIKFRSTRARMRQDVAVPFFDKNALKCPSGTELLNSTRLPCLTKNPNETFLRSYNCEYIKSPKPERFQRAMKQLYRPDYVLNHFIHYSTVTADLARSKVKTGGRYVRNPSVSKTERFIDELNEGVLIHAKTTAPDETPFQEKSCIFKKEGCPVGMPCPDNLLFDDNSHKDGFQDEDGKYCNCWINRKVEDFYVSKLEKLMSEF